MNLLLSLSLAILMGYTPPWPEFLPCPKATAPRRDEPEVVIDLNEKAYETYNGYVYYFRRTRYGDYDLQVFFGYDWTRHYVGAAFYDPTTHHLSCRMTGWSVGRVDYTFQLQGREFRCLQTSEGFHLGD